MNLLRKFLPALPALAFWQAASAAHILPQSAIPSPQAILATLWQDRATYAIAIPATLWPALQGFIFGTIAAIILAWLFLISPFAHAILRSSCLVLFAMPPLILAPVLVIAFHGTTPQILLAAICVYYPTLITLSVGLTTIDPTMLDLIKLYGGKRFSQIRWVRMPASTNALLAGLQIAAPAAILGAILAEFGSGAPGLGSFLLGTMSLGNPARLWGIALITTSISATLYLLIGQLAQNTRTLSTTQPPSIPAPFIKSPWALRILSVLTPLAIWQILPAALGVSPIILKTPYSVVHYLFLDEGAPDIRDQILAALAQSLPTAIASLGLAIAIALLLAITAYIKPSLSQYLMPPSLLLQSMPLVALTPIIVLLCGRGTLATLVIAIIICFFPAFITILEGLRQIPRPTQDLLRIYGATTPQSLRYVALPASLPYLCAAARLTAPSALLGVLTAEWLATGYGIGNLLNEARGSLDYGLIWSIALSVVLISLTFLKFMTSLEKILLTHQST